MNGAPTSQISLQLSTSVIKSARSHGCSFYREFQYQSSGKICNDDGCCFYLSSVELKKWAEDEYHPPDVITAIKRSLKYIETYKIFLCASYFKNNCTIVSYNLRKRKLLFFNLHTLMLSLSHCIFGLAASSEHEPGSA